MAKKKVENQVCAKCGAEVRKSALFCYHCGGAVVPEVAVSAASGDSVSSGWFRENIAEEETEKVKVTSKLESEVAEEIEKPIEKPIEKSFDTPIEKPVDTPIEKPVDTPIEKLLDEPLEKPKIVEETKLKSAAAMRRRAKIVEKKRVEEVQWEEHENAPNGWLDRKSVV